MIVYVYDGSFEGVLSCVFEVFKTRNIPTIIVKEQEYQPILLGTTWHIKTSEEHALRVLKGINVRSQNKAGEWVYKLFLSEFPQIEMTIYQLIQYLVDKNEATALENFANEHVLKASKIVKMINREVHRMHAFVRFQKTLSGLFYAPIHPDFNVLPLLADHFSRRYADQLWVIFDTRRKYGLYFDQKKTMFITTENPSFTESIGKLATEVLDDKEPVYETLWSQYFKSVNIEERKNLKLHLRQLPKRYWKYLTEKKGGFE